MIFLYFFFSYRNYNLKNFLDVVKRCSGTWESYWPNSRIRSMKVLGVTTSHLIRQYEIEFSRSGRNIDELDCRSTRRFPIDAFSVLVSWFSIRLLLLTLIEGFSILNVQSTRTILYVKIFLLKLAVWNTILFRWTLTLGAWILVDLTAIVALCSLGQPI